MELKETNPSLAFSNQACGAIMMALQKGILEQTDITDIIKGFDVRLREGELVITNPPIFAADTTEEE
tara:strand:+ start:19 stop:219 length:201 start_codon:yes stop_codon:yes gene_type:complete